MAFLFWFSKLLAALFHSRKRFAQQFDGVEGIVLHRLGRRRLQHPLRRPNRVPICQAERIIPTGSVWEASLAQAEAPSNLKSYRERPLAHGTKIGAVAGFITASVWRVLRGARSRPANGRGRMPIPRTVLEPVRKYYLLLAGSNPTPSRSRVLTSRDSPRGSWEILAYQAQFARLAAPETGEFEPHPEDFCVLSLFLTSLVPREWTSLRRRGEDDTSR
jgi:hypothetical protein